MREIKALECDNNGKFIINDNFSVMEVLLLENVIRNLMQNYSLSYLNDNPGIVVRKYNETILRINKDNK